MTNVLSLRKSWFFLWLIVLTMIVGCTGRRITTAIADQAFEPGPSAGTSVEAAGVTPTSKVEAAEPESRQAVSPTEEVRAAEAEKASSEVGAAEPEMDSAIPQAEERIVEEALTHAPPPQSAISPVEPVVELADMYFDFDQYVVRDDARSVLEVNAGLLKSQPAQHIVIEGHCDERGTSAYNLILGERRAESARQYLLELGVMSSQIQIASYGKERPFCEEHSEDCWQSNRRAHFRRP